MTEAMVVVYVALAAAASVIYPEEAMDRWPEFGGGKDMAVLLLAVALWPVPLLVIAWFLLRARYRTWRHPVPDTPEELHDER